MKSHNSILLRKKQGNFLLLPFSCDVQAIAIAWHLSLVVVTASRPTTEIICIFFEKVYIPYFATME
jgi:hypothetical protein